MVNGRHLMRLFNQYIYFLETLRKYPALPLLNRRCTKDYQIPGTNATLEKGTDVAISVMGIHHDEEYYPDHEKFDPERFNEINKAKLPSCCYLPFGEGPRVCIGKKCIIYK